MFYYVELAVVFGMSLFAMVSFALILSDTMEFHLSRERQLAHQRAEIMVLQMRPLFIFNTFYQSFNKKDFMVDSFRSVAEHRFLL